MKDISDSDSAEDVVYSEVHDIISNNKIISMMNSFSKGAIDTHTIAEKITDMLEWYVDRKIRENENK